MAMSLTDFQLILQLGLCDQFSDDEGDEMLSSCLGLYYLLSGLRRMMGEMDAVSLSGPLLPARGAFCRIMREIYAVLLVWVYTTSFQTLLDVGGDVCRLLVSSPVFTMAS